MPGTVLNTRETAEHSRNSLCSHGAYISVGTCAINKCTSRGVACQREVSFMGISTAGGGDCCWGGVESCSPWDNWAT